MPVAALVSIASIAGVLSAQTFTTLASFNGTNDKQPYDPGLIRSFHGNLYSLTSAGGTRGVET
jgi:hypothetical protein